MANEILTSVLKFGSTTYTLKDAWARDKIEEIETAITGGVIFRGETSTTLTDGATTNPIVINSQSYTAVQGDLVVSGGKEFVFDGTKWIELGDLSLLGALAWKDNATGNYTPAGTVSQPSFTGSETTSTGNFTPAGSVSKPSITVTPTTDSVYSITDVGTLPELTTSYDSTNETLTIGFSQEASVSPELLPALFLSRHSPGPLLQLRFPDFIGGAVYG